MVGANGIPSDPVRPNNFIDIQPAESHVPESPGGGAAVDGEGGDDGDHAEFQGHVKRSPPQPSAAAREHHEATGHAQFRNWCRFVLEVEAAMEGIRRRSMVKKKLRSWAGIMDFLAPS